MAPSFMAGAQLATSTIPVVGTALTVAFFWKHRHEVAALGAVCLGACILLCWMLTAFRQWWSDTGEDRTGWEETRQQPYRHVQHVTNVGRQISVPTHPHCDQCDVDNDVCNGHDSASSTTATPRSSAGS